MNQISDEDINRLLSRIKNNVPDSGRPGGLEEILKKMDTPETASRIRFTQLRIAGIVMLLMIVVNIIIMSSAGNKSTGVNNQEEPTSFLQPYNLNIYR